jgi:hypothetical protein
LLAALLDQAPEASILHEHQVFEIAPLHSDQHGRRLAVSRDQDPVALRLVDAAAQVLLGLTDR